MGRVSKRTKQNRKKSKLGSLARISRLLETKESQDGSSRFSDQEISTGKFFSVFLLHLSLIQVKGLLDCSK